MGTGRRENEEIRCENVILPEYVILPGYVILNAAKNPHAPDERFFAALRMTYPGRMTLSSHLLRRLDAHFAFHDKHNALAHV